MKYSVRNSSANYETNYLLRTEFERNYSRKLYVETQAIVFASNALVCKMDGHYMRIPYAFDS